MKLVMIDWVDSHSSGGWKPLPEIEKDCEPLLCRSVGWLLCEKNEHVVLVPHLSGMDDEDSVTLTCGSGYKIIPVVAIKDRKVLLEG